MNGALAALRPYLLLGPALCVLVFFFLGGLVLALAQSVGYFPVIGLADFTLDYYRQVLADPEFLASLGYTFYLSLVSTVLSTAIALYLAVYIISLPKKNRLIDFLYRLPIAVPHVVAAFMIVSFITQGGMISRLLLYLGLIQDLGQFPVLVYDRGGIGIILVYMWKEIPFITFMVYTVMHNIHRRLGEAALTLGATPRQVIRHVILPLSMPSIISATVIVFAFSFGSFEIPYLLGVTYPKALPVWAYYRYISPELSDRPEAMVISMTLTLLSAVLVLVYSRLMSRYLSREL